ncbi:serine--tRNA ligase, mitochondrial-like [Parus major]|uniref:serine--tRNA ligase, mitochondrial-like n=1 Tax=Parus major TaxID=9157 RepID=UPI001443E8A0|nr:serine--tRNA ligase, mitochondrial-like [Parus major]
MGGIGLPCPQVRTWRRLGQVRDGIARLEAEKGRVAQGVRRIMASHDKSSAKTLPELAALKERGRSLRGQLRALEAEESDLEQRFYLGALQLPNRTHPDVVRPPKTSPKSPQTQQNPP